MLIHFGAILAIQVCLIRHMSYFSKKNPLIWNLLGINAFEIKQNPLLGLASLRDKDYGSAFIRTACDVIDNMKDEDDILLATREVNL